MSNRPVVALIILALLSALLSVSVSLCAGEKKSNGSFDDYLLRDWLAQDAGERSSVLFAADSDGGAEKQLCAAVLESISGEASDLAVELSERDIAALERLTNETDRLYVGKVPGNDPHWVELYREICRLRRTVRLYWVVETAPSFVYAKHYVLGGSHYAYTENVSDAQFLEDYYEPGGALCRADFRPDGSIENQTLLKTTAGVIRDPEVTWDAKKILFSMRENPQTDDYHLYDYEVKTGKVRQLTFGLGFSDIEPACLPDGSILFPSTRCMQTTDCWWTDVSNLYTCDADGRYLRRISYDQVTVNHPTVSPDDGRVFYTRWDYNDRGQVFPQGLFVMNPDGTGQTAFYGNNSWFPTSILHARMIPNSSGKVVAISAGHHTRQKGKLILIDRADGVEENSGCHYLAPVRPADAERIDMIDQYGDQFQYPYPLNEQNFLVAMRPRYPEPCERLASVGFPDQFGIYWIDALGRREALVWDPEFSCGQQIPLCAREKPTQRPSSVDYTAATGQYYVQDVYAGAGLDGIERGTIKSLRIVALEFRAAGLYENWNQGRSGFSQCTTPIGCDNASWDVKRVLGEVPVEADGSSFFEVPARLPVYFQLLDANGDVVQTMRSWSTLQPNEFFACIGCHESKSSTMNNDIALTVGNQTLALRKGVAKPSPLFEPDSENPNRGVSFPRDIQPILDQYCVSCHSASPAYPHEKSEAPMSLASKPARSNPTAHPNFDMFKTPTELRRCGRVFSESYLNLTQNGRFEDYIHPFDVQDAPPMLPPYSAGSAKSPLMTLLRNPDEVHQEIRIDPLSLRRIAAWIDLVVPYCGSYTESTDWAVSKEAEYYYNLMKRRTMEELEQRNIEQMRNVQSGKIEAPAYEEIEHIRDFGREARVRFIRDYIEAKR